ncbi:MAG: hypothetical protein AB7O59_21000 [Pirellulales bacterium]
MKSFDVTRAACRLGRVAALAVWLGAAPARGEDLQLDVRKAPVIVEENFEGGADNWQPTDPASWQIIKTPKGQVYSLFTQSKYKPPHRSPVNIALLEGPVVSDFALDVKVQSTVADYNHRSLVLVFGYQDPAHFYYVHFGKKTDDHANQIFIVNDAPRLKISTKTTPGTAWDDAWHHVRIVRTVDDGSTAVFFDNLDAPVMTAVDKTFAWGRVGIGAFDDLGNFDDLVLRGTKVDKPASP